MPVLSKIFALIAAPWRSVVSRRAAGALVFDPAGRVLLVRDHVRREWGYPGGYLDAGEDPLVACVRELEEEIQLKVEPGRYQMLDRHLWARPMGELEFTTFAVEVTEQEAATIRRQVWELAEIRWVDRIEAVTLIAPRLKKRLMALFAVYDKQE